jgi:hypothetical protein
MTHERDVLSAKSVDLPDNLESSALAVFLAEHTNYRLWRDRKGEPQLVELARSSRSSSVLPTPDPFASTGRSVAEKFDLPEQPARRRRTERTREDSDDAA